MENLFIYKYSSDLNTIFLETRYHLYFGGMAIKIVTILRLNNRTIVNIFSQVIVLIKGSMGTISIYKVPLNNSPDY